MLDLNIGVMLIIAGIFFITMYLLKIWLFDVLVPFMDERERKFQEELNLAQVYEEEAKKFEEEVKEILRLAREDASKIIQEIKLKALEEAEKLKAIKQREIEEAKESLKLILQKEKEKILKELLPQKEEIKQLVEKKLRDAA